MTDHPLQTVVEVALSELRPDPDNPRRITARRRAMLERQVADDAFMQARPVIALPDGMIVAGEQRWRARAKIGRDTCFAFFADLDEEQRVEWAARDNNHAGEWVGDALGDLLGDRAPDRLALMGFTPDDVDKLVKPAKRERASAAGSDDLPDVVADPVTRPGDLIQLGAHRLLCGDSTDGPTLDRLLAGQRVDLVFMDPPYAIYGSSTGLAAEVADDKMVRPFFREALRAAARALIPFGHCYVCCDWRSWASWWEVAKGTGISPKNMIVWDKKGSGLGNNYANTHELVFFATSIPKRTRMTVDNPGQRSVLDANVWHINRVPSGEDRIHNAQKPVELVTRALTNSTVAGERILDLFAGSGTTLVAAEQEDRTAFLMEVDPAWCDAIVTRWERLTGQQAKRPRRRAKKPPA
jgi:DNA modification methylase